MFGNLLGKLVSAPIRIVNIAAKVVISPAKMMLDEEPFERNSVDKLAESVEEAAKEILD